MNVQDHPFVGLCKDRLHVNRINQDSHMATLLVEQSPSEVEKLMGYRNGQVLDERYMVEITESAGRTRIDVYPHHG